MKKIFLSCLLNRVSDTWKQQKVKLVVVFRSSFVCKSFNRTFLPLTLHRFFEKTCAKLVAEKVLFSALSFGLSFSALIKPVQSQQYLLKIYFVDFKTISSEHCVSYKLCFRYEPAQKFNK